MPHAITRKPPSNMRRDITKRRPIMLIRLGGTSVSLVHTQVRRPRLMLTSMERNSGGL